MNGLPDLTPQIESYEKLFSQFKSKIRIDGSTTYFLPQALPERIRRYREDAKILVMVRDPVERAFSAFKHLVMARRETLSFEQGLDMESARKEQGYEYLWRYREGSQFSARIHAFTSTFGSENVFVGHFDQLVDAPHKLLNDICAFAGLPEHEWTDLSKVHNRSRLLRDNFIMKAAYSKTSSLRFAKQLIPRKLKTWLIGINQFQPTLKDETRDLLRREFAAEYTEIEKLLQFNQDFSANGTNE
jgi:hypothetical protein